MLRGVVATVLNGIKVELNGKNLLEKVISKPPFITIALVPSIASNSVKNCPFNYPAKFDKRNGTARADRATLCALLFIFQRYGFAPGESKW